MKRKTKNLHFEGRGGGGGGREVATSYGWHHVQASRDLRVLAVVLVQSNQLSKGSALS